MPDREERFTVLVDAVAAGTGRDDPLLLDLGSGPGSLAIRLLDRIPGASVVAVDSDPLLLALGRAAHGDRPGLRFADLDLRDRRWADALRLDRAVDAAVSTTALHWLRPRELAGVYADLARVLRPGGLLLNGDHMREDPRAAPVLARLGEAVADRAVRRRIGGAEEPEDWKAWWQAATADPDLAGPAAERERRGVSEDHHGSESMRLVQHVAALRAAGFAEIGTLWQYGENRVLCAVAPGS
jgi:SAM-dependent methyltransferase